MFAGFIGQYIIGIALFIISCLKNLLFINLIYKVHSKTTLVEFDYRKKMFWCSVFAEITGFLAIILMCIIEYDGEKNYFYPISTALNSSFFYSIHTPLVGIIVGFICNFLLTLIFAFRNDYYYMQPKQKVIVAIIEAIINAPYTFFICVFDIMMLFEHLTMCFGI